MSTEERALSLEQSRTLLRAHIAIAELSGTTQDHTARRLFEAMAVVLLALERLSDKDGASA